MPKLSPASSSVLVLCLASVTGPAVALAEPPDAPPAEAATPSVDKVPESLATRTAEEANRPRSWFARSPMTIMA